MQAIESEQLVSRETIPQRQTNATQNHARQLADNALDQLAAALESGKSETLLSYLRVMSRFHRYSWNNCLLIALQRPAASHVAGFHTWRKFGRHVRKGAKGIAILAPMVSKKKAEAEDAEEDQQTRVFGFRTAYVFDFADTEGEELPEFASVSGDPQQYTDKLKAFIAANGIPLEYTESIAPAKGVSRGGSIQILPNLPPAETASVLAHELAHDCSTGERDAPKPITPFARRKPKPSLSWSATRSASKRAPPPATTSSYGRATKPRSPNRSSSFSPLRSRSSRPSGPLRTACGNPSQSKPITRGN